jgi:AGZA family xanthine/uracil permease-like MFS transporter
MHLSMMSNSSLNQPLVKKTNWTSLFNPGFYSQSNWFEELCEVLFKVKHRGSSIRTEVLSGFIHFVSTFFCLSVIPTELGKAGYNTEATICAVSLCSGLGCIIGGLFSNLPFVMAPPTAVTIFLSVALQENNLGPAEGSRVVIISGFVILLCGLRPLDKFPSMLIPNCIQVGTSIGIGLITALAGSTEIGLVEQGDYTILKMGQITPQIMIAFAGIIIICVATEYRIKGAFCISILFCSSIYWMHTWNLPNLFSFPVVETIYETLLPTKPASIQLTVELVFLYLVYLDGLVASLSRAANLSREDGTLPRSRWLYIVTGAFCICSGALVSAPILISPESSVAIKSGARTGLSAVVCGMCYLLAVFCGPLFKSIPSAGSAPILIMIGALLMQNSARVDWKNIQDAAPAFIVLFYIPMTCSILTGVGLGFVVYLTTNLFTGVLFDKFVDAMPSSKSCWDVLSNTIPFIPRKEHRTANTASGSESLGFGSGPQLESNKNINDIGDADYGLTTEKRNGHIEEVLNGQGEWDGDRVPNEGRGGYGGMEERG